MPLKSGPQMTSHVMSKSRCSTVCHDRFVAYYHRTKWKTSISQHGSWLKLLKAPFYVFWEYILDQGRPRSRGQKAETKKGCGWCYALFQVSYSLRMRKMTPRHLLNREIGQNLKIVKVHTWIPVVSVKSGNCLTLMLEKNWIIVHDINLKLYIHIHQVVCFKMCSVKKINHKLFGCF